MEPIDELAIAYLLFLAFMWKNWVKLVLYSGILEIVRMEAERKLSFRCGLSVLKSRREGMLSVAKVLLHINLRQPPPPQSPGLGVKFSSLELGLNLGEPMSNPLPM